MLYATVYIYYIQHFTFLKKNTLMLRKQTEMLSNIIIFSKKNTRLSPSFKKMLSMFDWKFFLTANIGILLIWNFKTFNCV